MRPAIAVQCNLRAYARSTGAGSARVLMSDANARGARPLCARSAGARPACPLASVDGPTVSTSPVSRSNLPPSNSARPLRPAESYGARQTPRMSHPNIPFPFPWVSASRPSFAYASRLADRQTYQNLIVSMQSGANLAWVAWAPAVRLPERPIERSPRANPAAAPPAAEELSIPTPHPRWRGRLTRVPCGLECLASARGAERHDGDLRTPRDAEYSLTRLVHSSTSKSTPNVRRLVTAWTVNPAKPVDRLSSRGQSVTREGRWPGV